jgi:glucose-1-phosphatase
LSSDVRLICFDLGRVLVRICEDWRHACKIARIPVPQASAAADAKVKPAIMELVFAHEVGKIELDEFCRKMSPLLQIEPPQVLGMMNAYLLGTYPGVIELIDALSAAGHCTACISNTNALHWRILQDRSGPAHFSFERLKYAFASHLVGHRKPENGMYEHVERVTSTRGEQILFFDDAKENVDAAKHRGWRAELILHDNDPVCQLRKHLARCGVLAVGSPR